MYTLSDGSWREDYAEYEQDGGWALTLPPPSVSEAHVGQHVVHGNTLMWSCHWITNGCGGSGYYYRDLSEALAKVGKYVSDQWTREASFT